MADNGLFKALDELNKKNTNYYNSLSEKEKTSIAPLIIMKWISGTVVKKQVILINEFVNPVVFDLYKHPSLLWKLMTICTTGKNQLYTWNKPKPKVNKTNSLVVQVIKEYFGYSTREAEHSANLIPVPDIIAMAEELGKQPHEIKKLIKDLKCPKKQNIDRMEL